MGAPAAISMGAPNRDLIPRPVTVDSRRNTGNWMANRTANRRSIHLFEKDWMIAQVAKIASGYPT